MTATGQKDGTTTAAASGDLTTGDPASEMDGPWVAVQVVIDQHNGWEYTDVVDAAGNTVVTVYGTGPGNAHGPRQRARVQMILASPDMLAAILTTLCPAGGWNGMPKGMIATVADCVRDGSCGCDLGRAVNKATGSHELNNRLMARAKERAK